MAGRLGKGAGDAWDGTDARRHWRQMPFATLAQAVAREPDVIYLVMKPVAGRESWTVEWEDETLEGPFPTLAAAKSAGDALVRRCADEFPSRIVREAGLDPDEWSLKADGHFTDFRPVDGSDAYIAHYGTHHWRLHVGGEPCESFRTPAAAAAHHADTRTPSPAFGR